MSTTTKLSALRGIPAVSPTGGATGAERRREPTFAELRARMEADQRREDEIRSEPPAPAWPDPEPAQDAAEDTRTPTVFFTAAEVDPVLSAQWRTVLWLSALFPVAAVGWSVLAFSSAYFAHTAARPPWPAVHADMPLPWGPVALCALGAVAVLALHVGMAGRLRRPVQVPAVLVLIAVMVVGVLDGMRP
jgi:hypothetical protein